MNRTPDRDWFHPMPPPRLAVVIPFPAERSRRPIAEQTVTRALNTAASSETRARRARAGVLVLRLLVVAAALALIAGVVS